MTPEIWRYVFDAIEDPVFLHDAQFRVLLANRAYYREAGMTEAAVLGKPYWQVFPPGAGPLPGCKDAMLGKGGAGSQDEVSVGVKLYLSTGYAVRDDQGKSLYSLHILSDITAQRQVETTEENVRRATETARDAIITVDKESGLVTAWNPAAEAIFGYSRKEVIGHVLLGFLAPPQFREVALRGMAHFAKTGNGTTVGKTIELAALHKDGTEFPIELSLSAMNTHGKWFTTGIVRDITERNRAHASEERYRRLFESAKDGILILDAETGMVVDANPFIMELLGYTLEDCLGKHIWDLRSLENVAASKEKFLELQQQDYVRYEDIPLETAHGRTVHVEFVSNVYLVDNTRVIQCNIRDITRRWLAEEKSQRLGQMYRTISRCNETLVRASDELGLAHDMCRILTEEGDFRMAWVGYAEQGADKRIRMVAATGIEQSILESLNPTWAEQEHDQGPACTAIYTGQIVVCHDIRNDAQCVFELEQALQRGYLTTVAIPLKHGQHVIGVLVVYGAKANELSEEIINLLTELADDLAFGIGNLRSKAERLSVLEKLEHIAHYDALTALPNRVLLADRLQQAMAQAHRRGDQLAVAYLDLDGFKAINDNYGHVAGDQLLMTMATFMKQALREGDTLARLGGDEFVAVLIDLDSIEACVPMLTRLVAAAAQPIYVGDLMLQVSASLGVTFYPQEGDVDADQLLRQADQAMYQAKQAGKNRYHVFDDEQDRNVRDHHENLERISRALTEREFVLYYQPKVNMRTGRFIGAEALIRWQHPEKGLLSPALFLPVIEEHQLSIELGEWVIDSALTQIELWHAAGLDIPVSVNVGARQLQHPDFVERLRVLLAAHPGVRPDDLEVEVLETSALEDLAQASQVIEACRKIGVKFALDDFGTGYSSLTYLKRLPFTLLKIDQSFVRDMLDDPDDLAILEAVLGLAVAFRRQVIAEGVETVKHGEMLLQLGCELGQGYGIAHPMPAHELSGWSVAWRTHPSWSNLSAFSRDDLPLLFAGVEHNAWMTAMENYFKDELEISPLLDYHQCRFGMWLDAGGLTRHGAQIAYQTIEALHRRVHVLGAELYELKMLGRNQEAPAGLNEFLSLGEALREQLKALVQENRQWAERVLGSLGQE
ncbi:MAG: EAL domain-containing protein [Methylococcaceae bacterium]